MGQNWSGYTDRHRIIAAITYWLLLALPCQADPLAEGWIDPPVQSRLRAFWWWLNGNVTRQAIADDLQQMKAKGFGGALIVDAGGADQAGNNKVPPGPTFGSAQWVDLFRYALDQAEDLGLEMGLNIVSGWNVGGPMVRPEDAVKKLTWSLKELTGPGKAQIRLPIPQIKDGFYKDLYVLAWRIRQELPADRRPIKNHQVKALISKPSFAGPDGWFLANSAPATIPILFDQWPAMPSEQDVNTADVLDISSCLGQDGSLSWDVPEGRWQVLRIGCTLADICRVSTHSDGWAGYALDVLDKGAFERYWDQVVRPLIKAAGRHAGRTLKYLHTDSWEIGVFNWTWMLPQQFYNRRGYSLVPYLPVIAGFIIEDRQLSNRFLHDFRKTLGELVIDNHYLPFKQWAAEYGMQIHPESGGPHFTPIDAQRTLGLNDVPISEFWAKSPTHRRTEQVRFFVKQPASAGHIYGHRLVAAEGLTTIGPHWQERLWDNLKPSFDQALTEGLNLLFWHAWVCSPKEFGLPGIQYFAGTHLNPNVTWWELSSPFFDYINRCQWMLQQGIFVADALYYYGDHVPNYAQLRSSDPAGVGAGYDYDVITEEAILTRLQVQDGRFILPDGTSYQVLVLPPLESISLAALRRIRELVIAGGTVIGPRPAYANGLSGYPQSDQEVRDIAGQLWSGNTGKGRVISGRNARQVLLDDGIGPDLSYTSPDPNTTVQYIHRRDRAWEIYFLANLRPEPVIIQARFRTKGQPWLWDPVTGQRRPATAFQACLEGISLPLHLDPYGSVFVVIDTQSQLASPTTSDNSYRFSYVMDLTAGPWTVRLDPYWGRPEPVVFDRLISWTEHPDPNIRYYSGKATYTKVVNLSSLARGRQLWLDLGSVCEIANVRLNGQDLGIVWTPPFRVCVDNAAREGSNLLEIELVNFWANRIIGDAGLPASQRRTRTNITALTGKTPLMPSGLLGPVVLLERKDPQ